MNDKDKEAFEKWWDEYPMGWKISGELHKNTSDSWQAACEYKDKEQYIEGSIHESGGIKREMTWKESSEMMERMYQGAIAQLNREYERIKKFKDEIQEYKEAARSEAEEVNRLQAKLAESTRKLLIFSDDLDQAGNELFMQEGKIKEFQAENKKLRDALELIAGEQEFFDEISDRSKTMMAREALKEIKEN